MPTKKPQRLVTEHTDVNKTANIIEAGLHSAIERAADGSPLASLTVKQVGALSGLVFYALGEVFERQFYPCDREQCQEVARDLMARAGLPVPPGVVVPDVA